MANPTKVVVNKTTLSNIANAIRTKGETTATLKPGQMPDAIRNLPSGGISEVESVAITNKSAFENLQFSGTYLTIALATSVLPANAPQWTQVVVSDPNMIHVLDNGDGTHSLHILRGGTCTVTVYDYSGTISDNMTITINQALEDISFAYSKLTIAEGGTRQLTVQFKPSTATDQTLVWSSTNENMPVSQTGLVTANSTGTTTITAYSATLDKTISCTLDAATFPDTADFDDVKENWQDYGAGSLLPDKLTYNNTEYEFSWLVVDANYPVTLPDGTQAHATILQMAKTLPFANRFSTETTKICDAATEPNALVDTYYYGKSGSTYTDLNLEVGDAIPYSDYDSIYKTGIHYTKNISQNLTRGYTNRWDGSEIRAIFNSDADNVKASYTPQHITDLVNYTGKGLLQMLNPNLLAVVDKIKNTTMENNASMDAELYETDDLFWLPSARQLDYNPSAYDSRPATRNEEEGTPFAYYTTSIGDPVNTAQEVRKIIPMGQTASAVYWLRSANYSDASTELLGNSDGSLNNNGAYNTYRLLPACAIIH